MSSLSYCAHLAQNLCDPIVLALLWSRRETLSSILPNLQALIIPLSAFCDQAHYPRLVLGPELKTIIIAAEENITSPLPSYAWDNVKVTLAPLAPIMSVFVVNAVEAHSNGDPLELGTPTDLMQLYRSFENLTALDAASVSVDHTTLSHLASLPSLQMLRASIETNELNHFIITFGTPQEFPSLIMLGLRVADLLACSRLLQRPGLRQLAALEVSRSQQDAYWDVDRFTQIFRIRSTFPALSQLAISSPIDQRIQFPTTMTRVTAKTWAPLLGFIHLSIIRIRLETTVDLDDPVLRTMALSWPHLEVLEIFEWATDTVPKVTLAGLLPLLASCTRLSQLTLRINALTDIPRFAQVGDLPPRNEMRYLNVCTSPIQVPQKVAAFLITVFPNLAQLHYGWQYSGRDGEIINLGTGQESGYYRAWREVFNLLSPIFKQVIHLN